MHQDKKQLLHSMHLEHVVVVKKILRKKTKLSNNKLYIFFNSLGSLHDLCILQVLCDPGRPFRGLCRHGDLHGHKLLHRRLLARLLL